MPKPSKYMNQREREICERVSILRMSILKWTQPALAKEIGITKNQLAAIEYKREPLRLGIARLLCEKFDVSQRWLALGILPIHPRYDVSMGNSALVNNDSLFSWVFDNFLNHLTGQIETAVIEKVGENIFRAGDFDNAAFADTGAFNDPPAEAIAFFVKKLVNLRLNSLPEKLKVEYARELLRANKKFGLKHGKQFGRITTGPSKEAAKTPLTIEVNTLTSESVKPVLPKLIERLKKATKKRGSKAALAKWLGVHRQSVTDWLSGKQEPGGEITLRLLHWVEQLERQK